MTSRILRLKEVKSLTGLSTATIYRFVAEKTFPHSFVLGARSVGWDEAEVLEWMEKVKKDRRKIGSAVPAQVAQV